MVEFDADFLSVLFHPNPAMPPVDRAKERVEHLIDTLSESGERILIPTPALSELLIALGRTAAAQAIDAIHGEAAFKISPFDERAAIELSLMSEVKPRGKKRKEQGGTWAKVKFDRQIVAIGKVNGVSKIYSMDNDIHNLAVREGLAAVGLQELPLPPPKTGELFPDREEK
jgi:predicted nucleic acid-binding protein